MSLRRVWVSWLLLALVLAPALGLVHGVLHGGRASHAHPQTHHADAHAHEVLEGTQQRRVPQTHHADAHAHEGHSAAALVDQLVPDHDGAPDCRLYDQQSHADLAPGIPMLVLPHVPIGFTLRHQAGEALARFAALFEARGPPAFA